MKATTDLFDLIQSLSPNEKRYFKRFATQHVIGKQNNYLRLFEAIAKQKRYDEDALRKRFKGERFIEHLPSEKNYLFQMVLKAMRRYQADKSVDIKLRDMLLDAELLDSRGLYKACKKILKKVGDLAQQYERWPVLIEVLFREKDMLVKSGHKQLSDKMDEAIKRTAQALYAYTQQLENHDLFYRLLVQTRIHYHQRDPAQHTKLEALATQAHGPDAPDTPFFVQLKHHQIQALLHQLRGESDELLQHFQAADNLWNSRPDLLKAHHLHKAQNDHKAQNVQIR